MIGHCDTCRHWDDGTGRTRKCLSLKSVKQISIYVAEVTNNNPPKIERSGLLSEYGITTGAEFGCINYEIKR